jgi:hypothetical protein
MHETIIDYTYHPKRDVVRKWVNGLAYFYFFQDVATHGYQGQCFILPITYSDRNDLINKLSDLNIAIKLIPEDSSKPIKGKSYSGIEHLQFKRGIHRFPEIEQPGHVAIFRIKCFVWVTEKHIEIRVGGNGNPEEVANWEVSDKDFLIALQLEDILSKMEIIHHRYRDMDLDRRYLSKRFYKENLNLD